jgi:hypothetical protein
MSSPWASFVSLDELRFSPSPFRSLSPFLDRLADGAVREDRRISRESDPPVQGNQRSPDDETLTRAKAVMKSIPDATIADLAAW